MQKITSYFICIVQLFSIAVSGGLWAIRPCDTSSEQKDASERCAQRAGLLAQSYFNNCYMSAPNRLIMNVGWLDTSSSCWEYCGLLSLAAGMAKLDKKYIAKCDDIIDGLGHFRHLKADGSFGGYAVDRKKQKNTAGEGVAYDDNMWLCRDLIGLYELTGSERCLRMATEIADFLISDAYTDINPAVLRDYGFDVPDSIGGFYWDYRHDALHTCSNGPAVQCLAALYRITGNESYLTHAVRSYEFLKCLVSQDGVFYDLMGFYKDENNNPSKVMGLSEEFYSYNSGSPITGAVELYRVTGEKKYLNDASYYAKSAFEYYAKDSSVGVKAFPDGNCWFNLILLNGFCALAPYDDSCDEYIESFLDTIDYAYDNYRAVRTELFGGVFLPRSWTKGFTGVWEEDYNSLTVSANAEVYARLADYYSGKQ